jgi:hypothetical protein
MKSKVFISIAKNFIQKHAARASKQKFANALAKVPHTEPADYDRLPASARKEKAKRSKKR